MEVQDGTRCGITCNRDTAFSSTSADEADLFQRCSYSSLIDADGADAVRNGFVYSL